MAWAIVLKQVGFGEGNLEDLFVSAMKDLGFALKLQTGKDDIFGTDFLKGWFVPDVDGNVCWQPFPSAVLKLGKTINTRLNIREFAYSVSKSVAIDRNYPLLGPFLAVYDRLGTQGKKDSLESPFENPYKPCMNNSRAVDREAILNLIEARYSISRDEVLEAEAQLVCVRSLPAFASHPVWLRLRQVDYD